jgi:hypothetical protein
VLRLGKESRRNLSERFKLIMNLGCKYTFADIEIKGLKILNNEKTN